jgi:hypothetical protein
MLEPSSRKAPSPNPTEEFLTVYHWRWGHETFHLMLKGQLELENFSGRTVEAIRQDVQAAVPVAVRPNRKVPRRRRPSFHRSYHFQRRVKKAVF